MQNKIFAVLSVIYSSLYFSVQVQKTNFYLNVYTM